jgi:hypothetical protein
MTIGALMTIAVSDRTIALSRLCVCNAHTVHGRESGNACFATHAGRDIPSWPDGCVRLSWLHRPPMAMKAGTTSEW